jgi:hypothetical protein
MTDRDALDRVVAGVVDGILSASDDEILADVREHYGDEVDFVADVDDVFNRAISPQHLNEAAGENDDVAQQVSRAQTNVIPFPNQPERRGPQTLAGPAQPRVRSAAETVGVSGSPQTPAMPVWRLALAPCRLAAIMIFGPILASWRLAALTASVAITSAMLWLHLGTHAFVAAWTPEHEMVTAGGNDNPTTTIHAERRVALVIGNNAYPNLPAQEQLGNAVAEARAVAEALRKLGFEVISGENVGRQALVDDLDAFSRRLSKGDTAFVFFAGHGVTLSGANYMLPSDIPGVEANQKVRLTRSAVAENDIVKDLQRRGVQVAVVVLDSSRISQQGGTGTTFSFTRSKDDDSVKGLMLSPGKDTFSIYTASAGQSARHWLSNIDGNSDSVFSRALVSALTRPGIDLTTLAYEVREDAALAGRDAGHEQRATHEGAAGRRSSLSDSMATEAGRGGGVSPPRCAGTVGLFDSPISAAGPVCDPYEKREEIQATRPVAGWRVATRDGRPWLVRWSELGRGNLAVSKLPSENECGQIAEMLLQDNPQIAASGTLRLWALDEMNLEGLCEKRGGRWRINPSSASNYSGLYISRENQQ